MSWWCLRKNYQDTSSRDPEYLYKVSSHFICKLLRCTIPTDFKQCTLIFSVSVCGDSVSYRRKGGGQQGVILFQGKQGVISPHSDPRQGASLRFIVRPGVANLQQNGEGNGMWHCRVSVEHPMGHNHQQPLRPPIHTQGSGSTPDLGQSGLGCGGRDSGAVVLTDVTEKFQRGRVRWFSTTKIDCLLQM